MTDHRGRSDDADASAWSADGEPPENPRIAREFKRAARSRRRVRALKIVLPLLGILIVLGGIAVTILARAIPDGVKVAGASIEDGRVVMDDPRMSGVDSSDRPFELVAQKAMQALTGGAVDLVGIDAKVAISDETNAAIRASTGHYDPNDQKLALDGGLTIETTDGLSVDMRSAAIDLQQGILTTDEPIHISTSGQDIRAKAMRISDNGDRIRFSGGVSITFMPNSDDDGLEEAAAIMNDSRLADAAPLPSGDQ